MIPCQQGSLKSSKVRQRHFVSIIGHLESHLKFDKVNKV